MNTYANLLMIPLFLPSLEKKKITHLKEIRMKVQSATAIIQMARTHANSVSVPPFQSLPDTLAA